jgi:predicted PurR-regulated permease PerM
MALGHFMMAFEPLFYAALVTIALGNGLFLPSLPSQINDLYQPGDARRSWAYNVYYVGINIGGFLAPLICGTLGEFYGWHYGFGAAGIGMVAGLLSFVPYLGPAVGIGSGLISALVSPGDPWVNVGLVAGVFTVGQLVESFFLTPWLVGDKIGLHPVAVIFALLAFGQIFGFFGILLALPVSAAILVGLRHLNARYQTSDIYRN